MKLPLIEEKILELLAEIGPWESLGENIVNVKSKTGTVYQLQILLTKEDDVVEESTSYPDMEIDFNNNLVEARS